MKDQSHLSPLTIEAARNGGFIVWREGRDISMRPRPDFAGTLDECLEHVRDRFSQAADPETDFAKAV